LFELFDSFTECFRLLLGTHAQLFHDFEDTPETQDNNQRSDLLENATQKDIYDEARDDDSCIEAVELGSEEAVAISIGGPKVSLSSSYWNPKAHILANSSSMNKQEKTRPTIPNASSVT